MKKANERMTRSLCSIEEVLDMAEKEISQADAKKRTHASVEVSINQETFNEVCKYLKSYGYRFTSIYSYDASHSLFDIMW